MKTKNCFSSFLVCHNFSSVPSIKVPSSSPYHPPLESHCTFINYPAGRLSLLILPPPPSSSFTATEAVRTNRQKHNKLFNGCTIIAIGPTNQPVSQSQGSHPGTPFCCIIVMVKLWPVNGTNGAQLESHKLYTAQIGGTRSFSPPGQRDWRMAG